MKSGHCFRNLGNQIYVILNWRDRQDDDDIVILHPLDAQQQQSYQQLRQSGASDEDIYKEMFPQIVVTHTDTTLDPCTLTKQQLSQLIFRDVDVSLPALQRMNREDLVRIYQALQVP